MTDARDEEISRLRAEVGKYRGALMKADRLIAIGASGMAREIIWDAITATEKTGD